MAKWRFEGKGLFLNHKGRLIRLKKGDETELPEYVIPQGFLDLFTPLEEDEPEPEEDLEGRFEVVHQGGGWYDVLDMERNVTMNDRSLRKDAADALKVKLEQTQ